MPANQELPSDSVASMLGDREPVAGLPATENRLYYPALDGVRAIAVLMVFWAHYFHSDSGNSWAWAGVDVFFVLSGFLITGILYDTRNAQNRFQSFYVRRMLRIFPLYYGVLLLALLLYPWLRWEWHNSILLFPTYLSNYARYVWIKAWMKDGFAVDQLHSLRYRSFYLLVGHFWSLAVEEQFYLVWPLVVFLVKDRVRLRNLCLGLCVAMFATRLLLAHVLPSSYLQAQLPERVTPLRADALLLGGALALMLRGPEGAVLMRNRMRVLMGMIAVILLATTGVAKLHGGWSSSAPMTPVQTQVAIAVIDLTAFAVILAALQEGTPLYRLLTLSPLRRLGQISYGFYVFHDIPHMAYLAIAMKLISSGSALAQEQLTAVLALLGTLALSVLSFRYYETPFLRLKSRFLAD